MHARKQSCSSPAFKRLGRASPFGFWRLFGLCGKERFKSGGPNVVFDEPTYLLHNCPPDYFYLLLNKLVVA
jgi:hypothetical protein